MALVNFFKSVWEWRMQEYPEFATFQGVHMYDSILESYTLESIEKRKITVESYLKHALELAKCYTEEDDKLNLEYLISDFKDFLQGFDSKGYFFPLNYLGGVHITFERLLCAMKKKTEEDFLKIIQRLTLLPQQISEIINLMREGIKNKMTMHSISISGVVKQLELLQVEPENSYFFNPFASISDDVSFSKSSKKEMFTNAKSIIENKILPSFKELQNFLKNEYLKNVRKDIAVSSLPNGNQFYLACLYFHIGCFMLPEEIHEIGLKEVNRIKESMEKIIEKLELKMTLQEFINHLRNESDFNFKNVDELLETYRGAIFNQIEPQLPKLFSYIPKTKLVIDTFPSTLPNAPGAFYFPAPVDGHQPGKFLINAANLKGCPKYDVMTLALHEAIPGHHLQYSYVIENENIPDFRRHIDEDKYSEAPSAFPTYTAYIEGWGLYSEYLGYELGLYDDVYLEFGYLSNEMLRACRLVVDTGIHAYGWSVEQAVEFIMKHTAFHKNEIEKEVNRYITWPGQACAYKIGEMKIKSLRKQAEESLGSKFDIKEFHSVILDSFGPLHILEKNVLKYIEHQSLT